MNVTYLEEWLPLGFHGIRRDLNEHLSKNVNAENQVRGCCRTECENPWVGKQYWSRFIFFSRCFVVVTFVNTAV